MVFDRVHIPLRIYCNPKPVTETVPQVEQPITPQPPLDDNTNATIPSVDPKPIASIIEVDSQNKHPFAKVRKATYTPPHVQNFAAPSKPTKESTAFTTQAPVQD